MFSLFTPWPSSFLVFAFRLLLTFFLVSLPKLREVVQSAPTSNRCTRRSRPLSPLVPTVSLSHTLASSYMVLSTVNVPLRCYPSVLQHRRKQSMRCQTHCSFFHKWPFFALLFMAPTRIYALPGTNHAIIPESSLDSFRQHALRTTAINNAVTRANSSPPFPPTVDDAVTVDDDLPTQPYSFITDTDSNQYLLHTGANRVILNDAKLLRNFQLANGNVKGVGGSPALIH